MITSFCVVLTFPLMSGAFISTVITVWSSTVAVVFLVVVFVPLEYVTVTG